MLKYMLRYIYAQIYIYIYISFKVAAKLYFTHYMCVVIISYNASLYKSAILL